jgi:hypothetical protein
MPLRFGATFAALALLSCSPAWGAADTEPVEYGTVRVSAAEPPARFAAGWPSSTAALRAWYEDAAALPINHALDGLLTGDPGLFERLRAASLAVEDRDRSDWVHQLQGMLEFRTVRHGFCANARPVMEAAPSTLREVLAVPFVQGCLLPGDRALVLRADTPASAVIAYFVPPYSLDGAPLPPWDDRLEAAVRAEYAIAGNAPAKIEAVFALTRHPDPRAEAVLLAMYREAPPGDDRIELGLLLRRGKSAEARAIGASVCEEHPGSRPCETERERREFNARMRADGFAVDDEDAPPPVEIPEPAAPPEEVRLVLDKLIAAGFDRLRDLDPGSLGTAEPVAILGGAGYLHGFDVETGQFPNAHDSPMRALAALTGDALAGAVFDEIPPVFDENAGGEGEESGPYRLSVYLAGKRYRIDAENHGDWYDLDAVLKLMNAVLADRRASSRLFVAGTDGQLAVVIAATPDAFRKAIAAGLFALADPGAAEAAGKAYEDEVLGRIR